MASWASCASFFALVAVGGFGEVLGAEGGDVLAGLGLGVVGDAGGVGTHVGDEADGALGADFDAFVEALGYAHGAADVEAEASAGLLLELAGGEGGLGVLLAFFALDRDYRPLGFFELGHDFVGPLFAFEGVGEVEVFTLFILAVGDADGFAVDADEAGVEVGAGVWLEFGGYRPVLDGLEGVDLALALDDEAEGYGLDAAGA